MHICYLIGARPVSALPRGIGAGDLVIAADRGLETCRALGVEPGLVVGDFDSLGYVPTHPNILRFPREKDDTDIGLALRAGEARGFRRFLLLGCAGGRPDHTWANYSLLLALSRRGHRGVLWGDGFAVTALTDRTLCLPGGRGVVSVFAFDRAEGVTLTGLQYPLRDYTMTNDYAIGVSNQRTDRPAGIDVARGSLLVMVENPDAPTLDALFS